MRSGSISDALFSAKEAYLVASPDPVDAQLTVPDLLQARQQTYEAWPCFGQGGLSFVQAVELVGSRGVAEEACGAQAQITSGSTPDRRLCQRCGE